MEGSKRNKRKCFCLGFLISGSPDMSSQVSPIFSGACTHSRLSFSLEIWHRDDATEVVAILYAVGNLDLCLELSLFLQREVVQRTKRCFWAGSQKWWPDGKDSLVRGKVPRVPWGSGRKKVGMESRKLELNIQSRAWLYLTTLVTMQKPLLCL